MLTYGGNDNKLKFDVHECELGNCDKIHMFFGDQSDTDMLEDMARQRPDGWDIILMMLHMFLSSKYCFMSFEHTSYKD